MIDTIWFYVENKDFKVPDKMVVKEEVNDPETKELIRIVGSYKNFKIIIRYGRMFVKGSLSRYFLGNNIYTLYRQSLQKAIQKLSTDLDFSPKTANVTRLDLAENIILNHPVSMYYQYLSSSKYQKVSQIADHESLLFKNKLKVKSFYDKRKEMSKRANVPFPIKYRDKPNILRYEFQTRKSVKKSFGDQDVPLNKLYEKNFYKNLIDRWEISYMTIRKVQKRRFEFKNITTPKQLGKFLELVGLNSMGYDELMTLISNQPVKYKDKQMSKLKAKVNSLMQENLWVDTNKYITELDREIRVIAKWQRAISEYDKLPIIKKQTMA